MNTKQIIGKYIYSIGAIHSSGGGANN